MSDAFSSAELRLFRDLGAYRDDAGRALWTPYDPLIHSHRSPSRPWLRLPRGDEAEPSLRAPHAALPRANPNPPRPRQEGE